MIFSVNKKVLLRDRKRHTARRVASTRSAVVSGWGVGVWWGGGYPTLDWGYGGPVQGDIPKSCPGQWYPPSSAGTRVTPRKAPSTEDQDRT